MKILILVAFFLAAFQVRAELYKCEQIAGVVSYQSYPCKAETKAVIRSDATKHKSVDEKMFDKMLTGDDEASQYVIKQMEQNFNKPPTPARVIEVPQQPIVIERPSYDVEEQIREMNRMNELREQTDLLRESVKLQKEMQNNQERERIERMFSPN